MMGLVGHWEIGAFPAVRRAGEGSDRPDDCGGGEDSLSGPV